MEAKMKTMMTLKRSEIIRPAEPTWSGVMPLTELDQIGAVTHVPAIYFYRPDTPWLAAGNDFYETVTRSLSEALVYFYPLAGRLRRVGGGRLEIVCNEEGAPVVEVLCDSEMEELGDFTKTPLPEFYDLVPEINYTAAIEEIPVLLVQITRFRCGSVAVGIMTSHAVVDGQSAFHFRTEWARLARGEPIGEAPFLDRRILRAGGPPFGKPRFQHVSYGTPPLIVGETDTEKEKKKETGIAVLRISQSQIETLKNIANKSENENQTIPNNNISLTTTRRRPYSRFEAIAAHIFRCTCRARRHVYDQPTGLTITVDVRNRMTPKLPKKYFGNAVVDVVMEAISGEIATNPLSFTASKIRETIENVTCDYVNSAIDYLKSLEDLSPLQDMESFRTGKEPPFYGNPVMGVVSWIGLPINGMDFGCGREIYMAPDLGSFDPDGNSRIIPTPDGEMEVAVCLQTECMDEFKKLFYENL